MGGRSIHYCGACGEELFDDMECQICTHPYVIAALARAEVAEAALCRAREFLTGEGITNAIRQGAENWAKNPIHGRDKSIVYEIGKQMAAALSSSAPCPESCPECGTAILENRFGAHHSASCSLIGRNFLSSPCPHAEEAKRLREHDEEKDKSIHHLFLENTRLSALEERCGDVEGIHLAIRCEWATKTDSKLAAHRVSRWLKEGT